MYYVYVYNIAVVVVCNARALVLCNCPRSRRHARGLQLHNNKIENETKKPYYGHARRNAFADTAAALDNGLTTGKLLPTRGGRHTRARPVVLLFVRRSVRTIGRVSYVLRGQVHFTRSAGGHTHARTVRLDTRTVNAERTATTVPTRVPGSDREKKNLGSNFVLDRAAEGIRRNSQTFHLRQN